jgi:hypothetical protein
MLHGKTTSTKHRLTLYIYSYNANSDHFMSLFQTYEVDGGDKWRKHRALKILRPTTELSGTYRCKVSSFVDEDFMQKTMIVYCK